MNDEKMITEMEECERAYLLNHMLGINPFKKKKASYLGMKTVTDTRMITAFIESMKLEREGSYGVYDLDRLIQILNYFKERGFVQIGLSLRKTEHPVIIFGVEESDTYESEYMILKDGIILAPHIANFQNRRIQKNEMIKNV